MNESRLVESGSLICVREARSEEVDFAADILSEVAQWLKDRGMPLWKPEEISTDLLREHQQKRELFLGFFDEKPAGTILIQGHDEAFWPEITDGSSLFFHRLAVRRAYSSQGVSKALIDYAYQRARSLGKTHLRMDCSAEHRPLRGFYESLGFRFVDQKQVRRILVDRMMKPIT